MLKKKIRPGHEPDSWQHHFSEIWSSDGRDGAFDLPNREAKVAYAKKFADVIRQARPHLFTINVASCISLPDSKIERASHIRTQKQEIFCISLLTSLQQLRTRKLGVRWTFDNVKDSTSGIRTEGWAQEVFRGLQYTRLFTWLSAGSTVLEPAFVSPGSNFLLEIADFISYSVARDFENATLQKKSDFPSTLLGQGLYQAVLRDGSLDFKWDHGVPLKSFWGLRRVPA
ncbi:hypothetical protein [Nevskia sp.]|uniref:hypothetical protein n=1 Tax=Nevskia sp. TaxID=1929292 RepID=UPI0025CCEBE3|nr:hypothetical protein [Nevskia sp.]